MKPYIVAPDAEDDLRHIWRYLLMEAGLAIANRDVLFFSVYQYMIVYRRAAIVEIVAVLHGKRNVKRLLKARLFTMTRALVTSSSNAAAVPPALIEGSGERAFHRVLHQ